MRFCKVGQRKLLELKINGDTSKLIEERLFIVHRKADQTEHNLCKWPGHLLFWGARGKNTICILPEQSRQGNNPCCQVNGTKTQELQCRCWPNSIKNEFTCPQECQHPQLKRAHPHTAEFSFGSRNVPHVTTQHWTTQCQDNTFCTHNHLQRLPAQV